MVSVTIKGFEDLFGFAFNGTKVLETKADIIAKKLAEIGQQIADTSYRQGGQGNTHYTVTVERITNGYKVVANGEDVGFLEFGAGANTIANTFISQVPYPVNDGSYSREHEGQYSKMGFWYYNDEKLIGVPPTHGMYNALVQMQSRANDIIREVMND